MTSDRPYRPCEMSLEMAIAEIVRCVGTQFDPTVVDALVAIRRPRRAAADPEDGVATPVVARV